MGGLIRLIIRCCEARNWTHHSQIRESLSTSAALTLQAVREESTIARHGHSSSSPQVDIIFVYDQSLSMGDEGIDLTQHFIGEAMQTFSAEIGSGLQVKRTPSSPPTMPTDPHLLKKGRSD